ncbi:MAG TPA: hypothetical protein VHT24_06965, partial [Pseudacidobacterium sp.]|nr:hypothetical protein [Pseudacidobacterium sp.]
MNQALQIKDFGVILALTALVIASIAGAQQTSTASGIASPAGEASQMEQRLDHLMSALENMRQQLDQSQQEMKELRGEIRDLKTQLAQKNGTADSTQAASELQSSVHQLQEQNEVLQSEVKQHDQTKVESLSKYPLRISGMLLFTSFLNNSAVDNIDLPIIATGGGQGSLSATARQTILGIEAFGPSVWGAHSAADINVDFFGGIPYADYTTSSGLLRLRTAHANLNWPNRSLTVAFDKPLISPLQPTSFVTVGEPALAWSGNLWTWSPQIQYKDSALIPIEKLSLELGLMDVPAPGPPVNSGL